MKVLVTGGAGYIGSVVTSTLVAAGHQVVVYDNLSHGHRKAVLPEAQLIVGDLNDPARLATLFAEHHFEAVMHFAAFIEAGESMVDPAKFFRNNTSNSILLLDAMVKAGVRKFVFSSTAALYGDPLRTPIEEDDLLAPTNAYGESKLLVERALHWMHRIHHLSYTSLRYFNAAGATDTLGEDHHPESHLIPLVLQVAASQRPNLSIFGTDYPTPDGTCVRDYVHIKDLASAHLLALENLQAQCLPQNLVYNLGNGKGFTVREVIDAARAVTGKKIDVVESPRRPGDPAVLVASSARIQRELRWKPTHPDLRDIIESAWQWRSRNPQGYKD